MDSTVLPMDLPTLLQRREFAYEVLLHRISRATDGSDNWVIAGKVTNMGSEPVVLGGAVKGSLNLGYRILANGAAKVIFEDRIHLASPHLLPREPMDFSAQIPSMELSDALIQVDFVYEEVFWFQDVSATKPYEISVAALQSILPNEPPKRETPRTVSVRTRNHGARRMRQPIAHPAPTRVTDVGERYVFDISDLIQFWRDNIRPTGIQRVQSEVLREIILERGGVAPAVPFVAIFFDIAFHGWAELPGLPLSQQIEVSSAPDITKDVWLVELDRVLAASTPYTPQFGDVLINLGSSWWIPDYLHKVQVLRLERGIRYIPFIHDAIPLVTPEHCAHELVDEFKMWFRGAVSIADHIIVNSRSSAIDVARWSHDLIGHCPKISVVPLNAAFGRPELITRSGILQRLNLDIDRYVLCVGTLEARKNHLLLLRVWDELSRRLPEARMAKLVLVGKEGWMFEAASALLARSRSLREHVVVLNNLSDQELAEVYEHCAFTVFPSFYEGWGLPVTEAVSYGKLTVASNTSSIPEAASPGDILLEPSDYLGWYETIANLLGDDQYLARATEASSERAELRTWSDVANDILRVAETSQRLVKNKDAPTIHDGTIYDFRVTTARANYECSGQPFRSGAGWHQLEEWGTWSGSGVTELKFRVASEDARYLYLVVRGSLEPLHLSLSVNGKVRVRREITSDARVTLRISLNKSVAMEHTIRIVVDKAVDLALKTAGIDQRKIGIGFQNMMCALETDLAARLNFGEALCMHFV